LQENKNNSTCEICGFQNVDAEDSGLHINIDCHGITTQQPSTLYLQSLYIYIYIYIQNGLVVVCSSMIFVGHNKSFHQESGCCDLGCVQNKCCPMPLDI